MPVRSWSLLARVLALTAGREALRRGLPLHLGVVGAGLVVFGGNGLHPATIVAATERSSVFRFSLCAAWALLTLPAFRALFATPATFFLRTLPVARWRVLSLQLSMVLILELPWIALWAFGGGLVAAIAATAVVVAGRALVLAGGSRPSDWGALGAVTAVLVVSGPTPLLVGVALPAAALAIGRVSRVAPELSRARARAWVRGPRLVALTLCHLVDLHRRAGALVLRALGLTVLGGALAFVAARNLAPRTSAELGVLVLTCATPAFAFALAGLTGPLLRTEAELAWLNAVCGTPLWTRRLAVVLAQASWALVLALVHGLGVGVSLDGAFTRAASVTGLAVCGVLPLAIATVALARFALRGTGHDALRMTGGVGAIVVVTVASLRVFGAPALIGWWSAALFVSLGPFRREVKLRVSPATPRPIGSEKATDVGGR